MQSNNPIPDHIKITHQPKMNTMQSITSKLPPTNADIRALFLDEVGKLVCKDRNVTHGDAEDNFRVIADLWNVYLKNSNGGEELGNKDVAIMMCLFKISRLMSNIDNLENWLDLAGYAACGGGIVKKSQ